MAGSASPSSPAVLERVGGRRAFLAAAGALALAAAHRPVLAQDFRPDVHLDPLDGSDYGDGSSPERAVQSFATAEGLMRPGRKLAIRRGTVIDRPIAITDDTIWRGCTIGAYGSGEPPRFEHVLLRDEAIRHGGQIWKVPLAEMRASSAFASQRIARATSLIIDGSRWAYLQVASPREVNGPTAFYHDVPGGWVYFTHPGTPVSVAIPQETPIVLQQVTGLTIQDIEVASSRDHGILAVAMDGLAILRCRIRRCGLVGLCVFTRDEARHVGPRIEDCLIQETHGNGIGFTASSAGNKPNQIKGFAIRRNIVRRTCMGVPWVASGVTSDDYYAGAIKLYSGIHDKAAWGWSGEIADNLIEHSGDLDRDMAGDHGQGIWVDTVTGSIQVVRNTIRDTRGAGVFVEFCPGQEITVAYNRITDTGQRHGGWTGGICLGRGTTGCLVHHNTVWGARRAALVIQGTPGTNDSPGAGKIAQSVGGCTVRDNILIPAAGAAVVRESPVGGAPSTFARNCVGPSPRFELSDGRPFSYGSHSSTAAWEQARKGGTASLAADPRLAAPPGDLRLQPGSPCLRAGTDGSDLGAG